MQMFLKILSGMANSVDPDLDLHSLHRTFCQKLWCSKFWDVNHNLNTFFLL